MNFYCRRLIERITVPRPGHVLKMASFLLSLSLGRRNGTEPVPSTPQEKWNLKHSSPPLTYPWGGLQGVERGSGERHSDTGPRTHRRRERKRSRTEEGKTNEVPENMFCFSPHTTKWHTSKHVKDQLELIELESGKTTTCPGWCLSLWSYESFRINFASLGNLISPSKASSVWEWSRVGGVGVLGFKFKWENGIKLIVPWCCRSRLSRGHSALPHLRAGGRTCTPCRDESTYYAGTLDTLRVGAIASLFRSVDSTCRP